mmetsp:Transcript_11640/g.29437  ORF Transcript_11640/g.29437 Transcript_11640/m.29437 type:complete len:104 (+) Transcript_11640:611-922(+)
MKIRTLRGQTKPLAVFIHHMERAAVQASWLYPSFQAIHVGLNEWCEASSTKMHFDETTLSKVLGMYYRRWRGEEGLVGLKAPQYCFSMIVDPTTYPTPANLPT